MKTQTPYEKLATLEQEMLDLIQREKKGRRLPDDGSRAEILEDRIREVEAEISGLNILEMRRLKAIKAQAENQDHDDVDNKTA